MVRTVIYVGVYADNRESSQDTCLHSFFDTFAYSRDVFFGNRTADNSRFEFEGLFGIVVHRLEFNFTVTILTTSTGLFCIFAVHISRFCDGLFVCNLRSAYVCFYLELTQQSVYDDFQMKLAHTCDDGLTGLLIGVSTECGVFLCQFCQRLAQFALAGFRLRLDSQFDNRFREFHGFQNNRMLLVTDGITGGGYLESDRCSDI